MPGNAFKADVQPAVHNVNGLRKPKNNALAADLKDVLIQLVGLRVTNMVTDVIKSEVREVRSHAVQVSSTVCRILAFNLEFVKFRPESFCLFSNKNVVETKPQNRGCRWCRSFASKSNRILLAYATGMVFKLPGFNHLPDWPVQHIGPHALAPGFAMIGPLVYQLMPASAADILHVLPPFTENCKHRHQNLFECSTNHRMKSSGRFIDKGQSKAIDTVCSSG